MTVEALKTLFDWIAVILLFLTFAAGAGVLITGNIINERQSKQLNQFDQDLRDKDVKIAEAKTEQQRLGAELAGAVTRGKEADARISEAVAKAKAAEAQVASAKAASDDAVAKVSTAEARIAEAQRDAARANETAERERLARLQLEARLADRVLTPVQQASISDALRPLGALPAQIFTYSDITEVVRIGQAIGSTLSSAGWSITSAAATGGVSVTGIVIAIARNTTPAVRTSADRLVAELLRNGIGATRASQPMEDIPFPGMFFGNSDKNAQIRILIGTK